jgi:hypothetical protein
MIRIIKHPAWMKSGERVYFADDGPASRFKTRQPALYDGMCETLSIDDFVASAGLDRVGLIKMDIEGAELPALKGAVSVIRKFRPKLAIAIYHSLDDFVDIPAFLDSLHLGYKFYLDHFSTGRAETILYGTAGD